MQGELLHTRQKFMYPCVSSKIWVVFKNNKRQKFLHLKRNCFALMMSQYVFDCDVDREVSE